MSVLEKKPQEILGWSLRKEQQVWLYFILPTGFRAFIYVMDLASGIAVVNEHFKAGYGVWGAVTLLLIYFPSLVYFIIIISRPNLWDEQDGIPGSAKWFAYRIAQLLFFPIWVMYRYAKQFFWAIDASLQQDEKLREEALQMASQPSQTELYLFLQAFLQAIPQAFLQLYIMLAHYQRDMKISQMQVFCITFSLMLVAHKTVSFLWFESQKIAGRKEPWSPKQPIQITILKPPRKGLGIKKEIDITDKTPPQIVEGKEDDEELTPFLQPRQLPAASAPDLDVSLESEVPSVVPVSGEGEVPATATNLNVSGEGGMPAPASNLNVSKENGSTSMQNEDPTYVISPPMYSAPARPLHEPEEVTVVPTGSRLDSANIDLPERRIRIKGREEDDPLGKGIAFLWWLFFLISRMLVLAACANFQPFVMLGVVLLHYIIVVSHLLQRSGFPSIYKVLIQLCLGYVYIFCFIEMRYKLKRVLLFYASFFLLMTLENIGMSLSWYLLDEYDGFWYKFVFVIIFGSSAISFMSMALYFTILKPKVISVSE
ncbi:uncharacterized protein [Periplaneta americana]|uniref:uncharacterized protein n=1 Tax=Periplaneta americana TaxID=6978 RepID=UPI0037E89DB6